MIGGGLWAAVGAGQYLCRSVGILFPIYDS